MCELNGIERSLQKFDVPGGPVDAQMDRQCVKPGGAIAERL
jgi:hypothetical protein